MYKSPPKVLVLLSTFNGEKYLYEHLKTINNQEGVMIHMLVRDDGSTDKTISILQAFKRKYHNITIIQEKNIGAARSFMHLMEVAATLDNEFDYYAFSDQDDIWLKDKISVAVSHLESFDPTLPLLYFSKPQLVDEQLKHIKKNWINLNCSFGEAMIVNGALGCTEVFNKRLLDLTTSYSPYFLTMHDAWIYRICLATGGKVFYDENAYILYRQHAKNVIGGKSNIYLKWKKRINRYIKKQKNIRLKTAENLLLGFEKSMTEENKNILKQIINYPHSIKSKIKLLSNKNIRTNSYEYNLIFKIAVIIGIY